MKKNRLPLIVTISLVGVAIIIGTIVKINSRHIDSLYKVSVSEITIAARKCYIENVCTEEKTKLSFLIEKNYIGKIVNPKNDEYFKEDSYVTYNNGKAKYYE